MLHLLLWQICLKNLLSIIPQKQFIEYISPIEINIKENTIIIIVPNNYIKEKIEKNYISIIKNTFNNISNNTYKFEIQIGVDIIIQPQEKKKYDHTNIIYNNNLNKNQTLENFIEDNAENFIKSNIYKVINNLGHIHNPLFIYSNSCSGKTHIIHAIGNAIKKSDNNAKIIIINAIKLLQNIEFFTKNKNLQELNKIYMDCNIFMIDDIHLLSDEKHIQETLIKIISTLIIKKKQIVMTSKIQPEYIKILNYEIKEKILSNIIVLQLKKTNFYSKIQILKNEFKIKNIPFQNNIPKFVTKKNNINTQTLKNTFKKTTTSKTYKNLIDQKFKIILIKKIIKITIHFYGTDLKTIQQRKRHPSTVKIRQIIFYLCKKLTKKSLTEIGNVLKYKHTTVLYSYKKIKTLIEKDKQIKNEIIILIKTLTK